MSDPGYIIRNYRAEDFNTLIRLGREIEKGEGLCCCNSVQDLVEDIRRPDHFPEDNLFVAEVARNIAGYLDVMPELNIGRAVLGCLVRAQHVRNSFTNDLVQRGLRRGRELRAGIAHVNIPEDDELAKELFSKMGFGFIRRFLKLKLDLSEDLLPNACQSAPQCRHLERGEEDKLTRIQNRSFADTWGYSPNTRENIMYRTSLPSCSLEDIILAWDGDKPIGYCWTKIDFEYKEGTNGHRGRIYMVGVDPDYRRRGVGKQVLAAGLFRLKDKGIRIVELTVDSENKAACALYRSSGFKVWTSSVWYEKVLA